MIGKVLQLNLLWNIFKSLSKIKNKENVFEKKKFRNNSFAFAIEIGYQPFALAEYGDKLFVGTRNGTILVIQNKIVISTFSTNCNSRVTSLLIDNYGHMMITCFSPKAVYIYIIQMEHIMETT